MSNPNRAAWAWRNSNPTYSLERTVTASSLGEAERIAEEIRATGEFSKVVPGRRRIGPRTALHYVFFVRCYKKLD